MRTLFLILAFAAPALAADPPKPNTLTQQEIADGWVLLFDGESTFGWKIDGTAAVEDGHLVAGGKQAVTLTSTTEFGPLQYKFSIGTENPVVVRFDGGADADTSRISKSAPSHQFTGKSSGERVRVRIEVPAGGRASLADFRVMPAVPANLFNGKSLAGWTVNAADPKRKASKFEVTDAGELRVTNGPGDLRTEKAFKDFILQFECKTNGDGLNSGVFFRCVPDEYQNGYEVQIQNAFKDGDRTKPADFGTGAIYRRVPARKVVANDKEWFTVTVLARGSHIATWVNGVPVVDWTDDRKPDPNPRKGLRTAAGHISIQGHDPTTDILFRNIRIAELK